MKLSEEKLKEICNGCLSTIDPDLGDENLQYNKSFIKHNRRYIAGAYTKLMKSKERIGMSKSEEYEWILKHAKADMYYGILSKNDSKGYNRWGGSESLVGFIDELDSRVIRDAKCGISLEESLHESTGRGFISHCLDGWEEILEERLLEEEEKKKREEKLDKILKDIPLLGLGVLLGILVNFVEKLSKMLSRGVRKEDINH